MQKWTKRVPRSLGVLLLAAIVSMNCLTVSASESKPEEAAPQYAYVTNQSVYFYDVADDYAWAFHEIDYLATLGVVNGTGDYLFEPETGISRADFVLMLYRAYDMSAYATGDSFPDVPEGAYYAEAVRAAKNLGITSGDNGRFLPDAPVTREDAMVFLLRTLQRAAIEPDAADLGGFSDAAAVQGYARDAVARLVGAGVISGDNGRLLPAKPVTRVEMAVMLYRALMIEAGADGAHYVAHPERVNVCIGDRIYSGAVIEDFDPSRTYGGLMELRDFAQDETGYTVRLGAAQPIDKQIAWDGSTLRVNGEPQLLAADCVAVQVAPYATLEGLRPTGEGYPFGQPSYNEAGEVEIVYYTK